MAVALATLDKCTPLRQHAGMIEIGPYRDGEAQAVVDLILPIQTIEFGVPSTIETQPDLFAIPDFYQVDGGGFWLARDEGRVVGTIALKSFGDRMGALRKMFVAADRRGAAHGVGGGLLATLPDHARAAGLRTIVLGTTEAFVGAHRFYEKNGFVRIDPAALPSGFPRVAVDTRFYALDL